MFNRLHLYLSLINHAHPSPPFSYPTINPLSPYNPSDSPHSTLISSTLNIAPVHPPHLIPHHTTPTSFHNTPPPTSFHTIPPPPHSTPHHPPPHSTPYHPHLIPQHTTPHLIPHHTTPTSFHNTPPPTSFHTIPPPPHSTPHHPHLIQHHTIPFSRYRYSAPPPPHPTPSPLPEHPYIHSRSPGLKHLKTNRTWRTFKSAIRTFSIKEFSFLCPISTNVFRF